MMVQNMKQEHAIFLGTTRSGFGETSPLKSGRTMSNSLRSIHMYTVSMVIFRGCRFSFSLAHPVKDVRSEMPTHAGLQRFDRSSQTPLWHPIANTTSALLLFDIYHRRQASVQSRLEDLLELLHAYPDGGLSVSQLSRPGGPGPAKRPDTLLDPRILSARPVFIAAVFRVTRQDRAGAYGLEAPSWILGIGPPEEAGCSAASA